MSNIKKMGICVIGLGVGIYHARTYSDLDGVDLYVCDLDPAKVDVARKELNVAGTFATIDDAIASEKVNAVDVCLPHHLHKSVAVHAAEAGKHCMVEKPIALNVQEADAMIGASERTGTKLAVAENYQFMEDTVRATQLIESGIIGTPFMVRVHELWKMGPRQGSWWFDPVKSGGGNLISLGIHLVRTLRMLAGSDATQVYALLSDIVSPEIYLDGEDTSMLSVKFENGVIGSVVTSWATPNPGSEPRFAVYGTDGSIVSTADQPLSVHSRRIEGIQTDEAEVRIPATRPTYPDSFDAECREFVRWLESDGDSPIIATEGRKDLEIVEAGYRSAKTGEAVRLPL